MELSLVANANMPFRTPQSFQEDVRAEFSPTEDEQRLHMLHASAMNKSWPWIFGTSRFLSPTAFLAVRCVFFVVFFGFWMVDITANFDEGLFFLFLTKWSFTVETIYCGFAIFVTYRARAEIAADLAGHVGEHVRVRLPWFVSVMYSSWIISMPIVIVVFSAFWTLLFPFWDLKPGMNLSPHLLFEHLFNVFFFIAELCLSRNAFHLKHTMVFFMYAFGYLGFTVIHFFAHIGVPPHNACKVYPLRDCPIYAPLDWHHPLSTSVVIVALLIYANLVVLAIWSLTRARARRDPMIRDVAEGARTLHVTC